MSTYYWHNEGKTRGVTFFAYTSYGLFGGLLLGMVLSHFSLLMNVLSLLMQFVSQRPEPKYSSPETEIGV